jgi:hypothetical protein
MKFINSSLCAIACIALASCHKQSTTLTSDKQSSFQCISAVITIADKPVNSVVLWNTGTGEARLLNSASFADKSSGQQGNLIGWVPLTDLQQAVQNLASQIQAQHQANPQPVKSPTKSNE